MSRRWYKPGDWIAWCQRCNEKNFGSKLQLDWRNLRVCKKCNLPKPSIAFPSPVLRGEGMPPPFLLPNPDKGADVGVTSFNAETTNWYGFNYTTGFFILGTHFTD